jgi:hypothetical protein
MVTGGGIYYWKLADVGFWCGGGDSGCRCEGGASFNNP